MCSRASNPIAPDAGLSPIPKRPLLPRRRSMDVPGDLLENMTAEFTIGAVQYADGDWAGIGNTNHGHRVDDWLDRDRAIRSINAGRRQRAVAMDGAARFIEVTVRRAMTAEVGARWPVGPTRRVPRHSLASTASAAVRRTSRRRPMPSLG